MGIEVRRSNDTGPVSTVCMPWGAEAGAFLSAFSALEGQNPELSHAAVLELLWPDLEPFSTRDN